VFHLVAFGLQTNLGNTSTEAAGAEFPCAPAVCGTTTIDAAMTAIIRAVDFIVDSDFIVASSMSWLLTPQ
jgi:hypothetical protein